MHECGVGLVGETVLARAGWVAGIEIAIVELQCSRRCLGQKAAIFIERAVETQFEQSHRLLGRRLEGEGFQRSDLRQNADEECEDSRAQSWTLVFLFPFLTVARLGDVVDEFAARHGRRRFHQLVLVHVPGYARQLRNHAADGLAVCSQCEVQVAEDVLQLERIGVVKCALQHLLGNFEADEIVIGLGRVIAAPNLEHIETEFHPQVRCLVVAIGHDRAKFAAQFGIFDRHGAIHGDAVALGIGRKVSHRTEREGQLIEGLRLLHQVHHEVARAHIMHQVAEELAAEGVIAHVLDDAARVGVRVRLHQIVGSGLGVALQQQRLDAAIPGGIDDGFVGQNGICVERGGQQQQRRTANGPVHCFRIANGPRYGCVPHHRQSCRDAEHGVGVAIP